MTVHDYRLTPPGGPRYQLIDGELHMVPAPNRFHQHISGAIEYIIRRYLEDHPIGEIYHAPFDVVLSDVNVFQPDILLVLEKHRAVLTDEGAEGAPDFVVEILSRSSVRHDTGPKREVYARTGVTEYWIVDPEQKRIAVYYLQQDAELPAATHCEGATFPSPLFPGLEFDTRRIFAMRT